MLRRTLQNLTLLGVSLLVTFVLLEFGVRLVSRVNAPDPPPTGAVRDTPSDPAAATYDSMAATIDSAAATRARRGNSSPLYDASDRLGWHLRPDTVQVFRRTDLFDTSVRSNQFGFRGGPIGPRPAGVIRYAVLGDSYGFGWGVEEGETYAARLEAALNAATPDGRRHELVNGALPGFGTFQRLQVLELLLEQGLDGVIAEFSVSNDVVDDWRAAPYVPGELGRYQAEGTRFPAFELFLERHSRLFALLRRRLMPLRLWFECRQGGNLERTGALWETLIDRCQESGLDLVILLNPSRYQVLSEGEGMIGALARTGYSRRPNRLIRELARERGVTLVDGEQLFDVEQPQRLFLGRDPHWTPAGHERVAEALIAVEPLAKLAAPSGED